MKITAMIMAGGRGERFWPKSRKNLPKQFLSLTDDGVTMIQHTVKRIQPLVKMEDIYIVTNRDYKGLAMEQLPAELTQWEESAIRQLVDTVKVLSKDRILVCLRCGAQIEQEIEA